jgi:hypothetical protein
MAVHINLLLLKSNRPAGSFLAWLTALPISIGLACETMSDDGMGG